MMQKDFRFSIKSTEDAGTFTGLASPEASDVATDKAHPRAGHDLRGAVIDQKPPGNPDRNVGD